jgi:hypothetical protein
MVFILAAIPGCIDDGTREFSYYRLEMYPEIWSAFEGGHDQALLKDENGTYVAFNLSTSGVFIRTSTDTRNWTEPFFYYPPHLKEINKTGPRYEYYFVLELMDVWKENGMYTMTYMFDKERYYYEESYNPSFYKIQSTDLVNWSDPVRAAKPVQHDPIFDEVKLPWWVYYDYDRGNYRYGWMSKRDFLNVAVDIMKDTNGHYTLFLSSSIHYDIQKEDDKHDPGIHWVNMISTSKDGKKWESPTLFYTGNYNINVYAEMQEQTILLAYDQDDWMMFSKLTQETLSQKSGKKKASVFVDY